MSDALTPLRHVYGVEPIGAAEAPGGAGHPEQEALRQLRALLDTWPTPAPSAQATAAVEARAAVVAAAVSQTDAALAQAFASRPQPGPSSAVVDAVLARAAEPTGAPDALPAGSPAEAALLDQSLRALDRLPASRPDAAVIAAIEARAAEASAALDAVRHVYLDAPAVATVEAEALRQSRAIVERALASRPQPRPSSEALDAVLARAAEASGVEAEPALEVPLVEGAVLAQSLRALDRLPRPQPSAATLDAVRLVAATAGTAPVRDDRPARSADRSPAPPARRRAPVGVWAGAAGLLVAALAVLVVRPFGGTVEEAPVTAAAVAEVVDVAAPEPPAPTPVEEAVADLAAPAPSAPSPGLAVAAPLPGLVQAAQRTVRPTPPPSAPAPEVAAAAPAPPSDPPTWEASDDVRALSLRLQELDSDDALAWDDAPAEAFGVPAASSAGAAPGIQAVRAGAPAVRPAPARARLRLDSSSVQR